MIPRFDLKKEPLYLLLIVFIILINLSSALLDLGQKGVPEKQPKKRSRARELIERRSELKDAIVEDKKASIIASTVALGIILLVFVGLLLDFAIFIRKTGGGIILDRSLPPPQISWNVWDALKVIILFISFGYLLVIVEALLSRLFPSIKANERIISIVNTTIMDITGIGIVFYFVLKRYRHKIKDLGLTLKNFFKNISYGILGYVSLVPVLIVGLLIVVWFVEAFKYKPSPQPVLELFLEERKIPVLVYLSIFVAVVGPVMEEIFFRGFLYNAIKKDMGIRWAIIISAGLFSLLHAHLVGFLPILILGIFLAYLYEKTGSLVSSITLHIMHNIAMVFFVFLIKGITF